MIFTQLCMKHFENSVFLSLYQNISCATKINKFQKTGNNENQKVSDVEGRRSWRKISGGLGITSKGGKRLDVNEYRSWNGLRLDLWVTIIL